MLVGLTEMEVPVPIKTPPQLPVNQFHEAPVPRVPDEMESVEELPEQTEGGEAVAVGIVEAVFMAIANVDNAPDPQALVPSTVILPAVAEPEKFTVIEFVLVPEEIEAPEGKTQLYPAAPDIAPTE